MILSLLFEIYLTKVFKILRLVLFSKYAFRCIIPGLLAGIILVGCNPYKYVPSGKYLLGKNKIICDNKKINQAELNSCLRQKENKRILGMRFYLGLYDLSNTKKNTWINKKLRDMGEEPVIWDPEPTRISTDQLKSYLDSKGYLNSVVSDTVLFKKKKAEVIYHIRAKTPYSIRSMKYFMEDTSIQRYIYSDTSNIKSNLKVGQNGLFDIDLLGKERGNIEYMMRNNGYFMFSRDMIMFEADTSHNQVDLLLSVSNQAVKLDNGQITSIPNRQYKINQVVIRTENDRFRKTTSSENDRRDTISRYGVRFVYQNNFWVRPSIIQQSNYIMPGSLFRISDVEQTKSHLSSLNVFSIVNTNQFTVLPGPDTSKYRYLDCQLSLTPLSIQSYDWGLVGTNSSGNFGGAVNLIYLHRSLFGNAENLNLKFKWSLEALQESNSNIISRDIEYGVESTINIPKFFIPFNSMGFRKKYNPKTSFTLAYNYQDRPDFKRGVANASMGYNWRVGAYKTHILTPITLNLVKIPFISQATQQKIDTSGAYVRNLYSNHLIACLTYSYIYNNQDYKKKSDYRFFQLNFESGGNLLQVINSSTHGPMDTAGNYTLLGLPYAQYVKGELDFHYFHRINEMSGMAYRMFAGVGVPYGNSRNLPFEKQFISGGPNSIRGWQVGTLGPGNTIDTSKYPTGTGDIKLEANMEYRFKLFWIFEGALFAEAGNIWLLPTAEETKPKNAVFKWNKFYKQIALGSGAGLRLNFNYFLVRLDLGFKIIDPSKGYYDYYNSQHRRKNYALSFAIGYPF